jgi:hypothetical protein
MSPVWNVGLIRPLQPQCLVFLGLGLRKRRIPPSRRLNSLFSRTEEIIIHRPLDVVLDAEAKTSLERTIDRNTSLPGVSGHTC